MDGRTGVTLILIVIAAIVLFALIAYNNRRRVARRDTERFRPAPVGSLRSTDAYAAPMPTASGTDAGDKEYAPIESSDAAAPEFKPQPPADGGMMTAEGGGKGDVMPVDPLNVDNFKPVDFGGGGKMAASSPNECYPSASALYNPEQLLPKDAANSKWSQVNPAGQGDVKNQNLLTAGYHIGINTQGNSLRNPSYDIRPTIPNPRVAVSPWMQSTIEPDLNIRSLDGFGP